MKTNAMADKNIHQGKNVKRFREMLGLKQEWLAFELGDDWSQKKVSQLENKEEIDNTILEQVAKILNVPADAIRNFDETTAMNNIQNNYDSVVVSSGPNINNFCTINTAEKWLEAIDENKKLYERMLADKDAMIKQLGDIIAGMKQ
ncbi:helix-turn-helix domain-containing protein [Chitinophagaceae bacterium MMS25-I14]